MCVTRARVIQSVLIKLVRTVRPTSVPCRHRRGAGLGRVKSVEKAWCRNNLWLKIYVQWKSKSSDAFISGQCNSVSMATSPWVFRIAALHLNLGCFFLFFFFFHSYGIGMISVIKRGKHLMLEHEMKPLCRQHHLVLRKISSEICKSTRRRYCTSACQNRWYSRRKNEMKYLWGLLFTREEAAQLPRSVGFFKKCCYLWKKALPGTRVEILSAAH